MDSPTATDPSFKDLQASPSILPDSLISTPHAPSGESITGGIPGGYDVSGICIDGNVVQFFAGQVSADRANGTLTGPLTSQYMRGMQLSLNPDSGEQNRSQFIQMAMNYMSRLGTGDVAGSPTYTPRATFDTATTDRTFERRA